MSRQTIQARFLSLLLISALFGCGGDDSLARQRAEDVFRKAKQALVRGDYQDSKRLLAESVSLYEYLGNEARLAETSVLLGETLCSGAQFDSGFAMLTRARGLYQQLSDKPGTRAAVLALANAYRTRGEDLKAFDVLTAELRLEQALGDQFGVRELEWALIPVCRALGDEETEQRLMHNLLDDYSKVGDSGQLAKVHGEFGLSSMERKRYPDAIAAFTRALSYAQLSKDTLSTIRGNLQLAVAYDKAGMQDEAFRMFSEGLRKTDRVHGAGNLRGEMLLRVGNIYLRSGRYSGAHKFLNAALRSAMTSENRLLEAYALLQLGHCLSHSSPEEARASYNAGANLIGHIGVTWANAYAQSCLGAFALEAGNWNAALGSFRMAASSSDSSLASREDDLYADCERCFYDSRRLSPRDALTGLLIRLGKSEEAFQSAECQRSFNVFRKLNSLEIRVQNNALNSALQRFADIRGCYIGAERQLASAFAVHAESRTLAADVRDALARASARMRDLGDSLAFTNPRLRPALTPDSASVADTQKRVPAGSTLVGYVATEQTLFIYVVSGNAKTVRIVATGRNALRQLISNYWDALKQSLSETNARVLTQRLQELRTASSLLYNAFVRPLDQVVPVSTGLLVLLPEDLPFVPVHALQQEGRAGEFAIERYSVRYLPGEFALRLTSSKVNPYPVVVGFGNEGGTSVDVEYEVRDAKAFFKEAKLYFNKDATLERLQAEKGDILHVALDLRFRPDKPGNSFFVLNSGPGYASSRYYRLGELFSVSGFPAVLVSNISNDMLDPLVPCILRMNGSANVVMNCYVPLRRTKKFFDEVFYTSLLSGVGAEDAYRNALLAMIRNPESSMPSLWAGFTLW